MTRSVDSALTQSMVNCYRQSARTKSQNTPNKVFTPKECYECEAYKNYSKFIKLYSVADQVTAKRTVDFDNISKDESALISEDEG